MPLFDWLADPLIDEQRAFKVLEVGEHVPFDDVIKVLVSEELIRARVHDDLRAELIQGIHKPKYRQMLEAILPTRPNAKKGDFGEIVAAALLESSLGYVVPVKKLRFKMRKNDQPTGIDVVAFRLNQEASAINEICYLESKLRSGANKYFALQAHDQLQEAFRNDLGELNFFISSALHDRNDPLYPVFMTHLGADNSVDSFCVALHADSATWDPEALTNLAGKNDLLDPLFVLLFKIAGISDVVKRCFEHAGIIISDEDHD